MNPTTSRIATLLGSASFFTIANVFGAYGQEVGQQLADLQTPPPTPANTLISPQQQAAKPSPTQQNRQVAQANAPGQQVAQAPAAPAAVAESIVITGSLIAGAAAIGVPVTNLGGQDFIEAGTPTIGDLFRTVPVADVAPGPVATNSNGHNEREIRVNIRGLDQTGPRSLMLIDGFRFPPQADGICAIDPSIIPSLAVDRIDILADGASATYGSDAIAGVINIILKKGYDGAQTQLFFSTSQMGGPKYQAQQLWGRTWDGGDITLVYAWENETPIPGKNFSKFTVNYSPWGLPDHTGLFSSLPGTLSLGGSAKLTGAGAGFGSNSYGTACTNCYAIPAGAGQNFDPFSNGLGPGAGGNPNAPAFDWSAVGANGTNNVYDAVQQQWLTAAQQHNSAVMTFDQRITNDITFFGEGFYSNRRVEFLVASQHKPVDPNGLKGVKIPTWNPYYPTNSPTTDLRVYYDIGPEMGELDNAFEVSARYAGGFNFQLPFDWAGKIYYSRSYEENFYYNHGIVDRANVSAALGWTVGPFSGSGTYPGVAAYTKPANIPYLNLLCDPTVYQCNSRDTLNYLIGIRTVGDRFTINEYGGNFNGPLFDLPAGQVKLAVGGTFDSDKVIAYRGNNTGNPDTVGVAVDPEPYQVWAGFAQLNVPVFGNAFSFPLLRRLDLEASWRHDQYYGTIQGATSNPKFGFTWELSEDLGATVTGGWGTSFRFANAGEYSVISSDSFNDYTNQPGNSIFNLECTGGAPAAGSLAAKLYDSDPSHTLFACGKPYYGLSWGGGPHIALRQYTSGGQTYYHEGGPFLAPEKSTNYSIGLEVAPTISFLQGLDVRATWYSVKINGTLNGYNNPTAQTLNSPSEAFHMIVPSDLVGCTTADNLHPWTCAPFETMAAAVLSDPGSDLAPTTDNVRQVYWIVDGSTANVGYTMVQGIDFNGSYNWDMGDLGAWNVGIVGTYYLHRYSQSPGAPRIDEYHQQQGADTGVETLPRFHYRARLGWASGPWSVTGFLNYQSHYYDTQGTPPNVNNQCIASGSQISGGTYPCAITGYTNLMPSWYTFDLSFGYNTGDMPVNDYLKNIGIQLSLQNIFDKHPAFQWGPSEQGRASSAYDLLYPPQGRVYAVTITKTW
jgi:iron complex outermembrane recepter protein